MDAADTDAAPVFHFQRPLRRFKRFREEKEENAEIFSTRFSVKMAAQLAMCLNHKLV